MIKQAYALIKKIEDQMGGGVFVSLRIPNHEPAITFRMEWDVQRTIIRYEETISLLDFALWVGDDDYLIQRLAVKANECFELQKERMLTK